MTITIVRRDHWEERGWEFGTLPSPVFPLWGNIQWLVVHWPGGNVRPSTEGQMLNLIRAQQRQYRSKEKPYNLGYNWLLDPWGKFWESRGFAYRNAANEGDKIDHIYGNVNWITMSVQIVCNLNEGANDAQIQAMMDMQKDVNSLSGRWMPWRPHWFSDATACPGPTNSAFIEADAFNYRTPTLTPPRGNNPIIGERKEQTVMINWNGMKMEYDGFRIRRIVSSNAVIGSAVDVLDVNVFDIINEPNVVVVGPNPFEGTPGLEPWKNDFLAAAWRTKEQQGFKA